MYNAWGQRGPADNDAGEQIGERMADLMRHFPFYGETRAREIAEREYQERCE